MKVRRAESGAALLVILAVIIATFAVVATSSISINALRSNATSKTNSALKVAQAALTGYALNATPIGTLPCPDTDGDGLEDAAGSDCDELLGHLPYKTLNIDMLKDGYGERLWYAVEANYTANNAALKNASTFSSLNLDGIELAALVLAANRALDSQQRSLPLFLGDYLEGTNADANYSNFSRVVDADHNDILLAIEKAKYWRLVSQSIAKSVSDRLLQYRNACGEFPWAADIGGAPYNSVSSQSEGTVPFDSALPSNWNSACAAGISPETWWSNHWGRELRYSMCTASQGQCLQINGDDATTADAILIAPGVSLAGQIRPSSNLTQYFESENAQAGNPYEFYRPINHDGNFNDVLQTLRL